MASIKLSVTIAANLEAVYSAAARQRIDKALKRWIAAESKRGITTVHLALDDAAAMTAQGVAAIKPPFSAEKAKRALDALCKKLAPDYVCLFGGHQIVPMFIVRNPSFSPTGDDDKDVPTDNPYACSTAYSAKARKSYLMPDRVLGRITDLPGDGDPAWLVDYLQRAAAWQPRPASFYASPYVLVCEEWKAAGAACMQYIGLAGNELQQSPPTLDTSAAARSRLERTLHMIKCHGAALDPRFYGQQGSSYPEALRSSSLPARIKEGTLAGSMCCYGAQAYSPKDKAAQLGELWPIANTYLRHGAVGFAGATRIAWVGLDQMQCADWIVAAHLKSALGGASLGRAFLEAKQDYVKYLTSQGQQPDTADEKTLLEFVLLGDPALHPVAQGPGVATTTRGASPTRAALPTSPLLQQERGQRRVVRAAIATQIRRELPERHAAAAKAAQSKKIFDAVSSMLSSADAKALSPSTVQVERVVSRTPAPPADAAPATRGARPTTAAVPAANGPRESLEYYWTARSDTPGSPGPAQIRLLKVETDTQGRIVRTRLLHSA